MPPVAAVADEDAWLSAAGIVVGVPSLEAAASEGCVFSVMIVEGGDEGERRWRERGRWWGRERVRRQRRA